MHQDPCYISVEQLLPVPSRCSSASLLLKSRPLQKQRSEAAQAAWLAQSLKRALIAMPSACLHTLNQTLVCCSVRLGETCSGVQSSVCRASTPRVHPGGHKAEGASRQPLPRPGRPIAQARTAAVAPGPSSTQYPGPSVGTLTLPKVSVTGSLQHRPFLTALTAPSQSHRSPSAPRTWCR